MHYTHLTNTQILWYIACMTTFVVVHYNRATRSLDGLEEFEDFEAAERALEAAQLAQLATGNEVEVALLPETELGRFLGPGDVQVPSEPKR